MTINVARTARSRIRLGLFLATPLVTAALLGPLLGQGAAHASNHSRPAAMMCRDGDCCPPPYPWKACDKQLPSAVNPVRL